MSGRLGGRWPLLAVAVLVGSVLGILLVVRAPVRDELHTLAQTRPATLDRWVDTTRRAEDRTPAAANLLAWAGGRAHLGSLRWQRSLAACGWLVGALALALVVRRHGGGAAATLVAGLVPSASGLVAVGALARPYGLAFGALCIGIERWSASLSGATTRRVIALAVALVVAVSLHYAVAVAIPCLAVGELVARRRLIGRPWSVIVGLGCGLLPLVVLAASIGRSLDSARSEPRATDWTAAPAFYLSVGRPLVVAAAVLAIGLVVLRDRSISPRRWLRSPLAVATALLIAVVPTAVVMGALATRTVYLHRYAMGALAGLALAAGGAVLVVERRSRAAAGALAALVVLALVPATVRALDEGPTRTQVHAAVEELELAAAPADARILVVDPYVASLLREEATEPLAARIALAGPSTIAGDRVVIDLRSSAPVPAPERGEVVVIADDDLLASMAAAGRLGDVRELGRSSLRTSALGRDLVAVEAELRR